MKRVLWYLCFLVTLSPTYAHALNDNYSQFFAECNVSGVFGLYDQAADQWHITNPVQFNQGSLPASTFKIVNSLIGLDTGVTYKGEVFTWDGTQYSVSQWNKNLSLEAAFKHSAAWVFEQIHSRLDNAVYIQYLTALRYGNGNVTSGKLHNFWVYGDFSVTPRQQIELLKGLYANNLPFSQNAMNITKEMMLADDPELGDIYSKTGWTRKKDQDIGWWVGYLPDNGKPIFFATRINQVNTVDINKFLECRKSITRKIISLYQKNKMIRK